MDARVGEEPDTSDDADFCVEPSEERMRNVKINDFKRNTHENLALSTSARAARRRSSRAKAASLRVAILSPELTEPFSWKLAIELGLGRRKEEDSA